MTASPRLTVRSAVLDDAGEIVALVKRLARFEEPGGTVTLDQAMVARDCFGTTPRFEALLAEAGAQVVGGVLLLGAYSSWAGRPTMIIHDLFVDESARGLGVGKALLAKAAEMALQRRCCRLDVNVLAWNEGGRRFYERLGFKWLEDWLPYRLDEAGMRRLVD